MKKKRTTIIILFLLMDFIFGQNYFRRTNGKINDYWNNDVTKDKSNDKSLIEYKTKKPVITRKLISTYAILNERAIFICHSTGNPTPTITWLVNNRPKNQSDGRFYLHKGRKKQNGILEIKTVFKMDNKSRITCVARNGLGPAYSNAKLSVYNSRADTPPGFPVFKSKAAINVLQKDNPVTLPCTTVGNPKPKITWLKDMQVLQFQQNRYLLQGDGGLRIPRTKEEDNGIYQCIATNIHGTIVSSIMKLLIRDNVEETYLLMIKDGSYIPPKFIFVSPNEYVHTGSQLSIRCRVIGAPKPKVVWQCNNINIKPISPFFNNSTNSHVTQSIVMLSDISDPLSCTCIASTKKDVIRKKIYIRLRESFPSPKITRISELTDKSAIVLWTDQNGKNSGFEYYLAYKIVKTKEIKFDTNKIDEKTVVIQLKKTNASQVMHIKIDYLRHFTNYSVWIEARSSRQEVAKSPSKLFTTLESDKSKVPSTPPAQIQIEAYSENIISIKFSPPTKPNGIITHYYIYYSHYPNVSMNLWKSFPHTPSGNTSGIQKATISHVSEGKKYYVKIAARNSAGIGPTSEPIMIVMKSTVIQALQKFRAPSKTSDKVHLEWQPYPFESRIVLPEAIIQYRQVKARGSYNIKNIEYNKNNPRCIIDKLKSNTSYEFIVKVRTLHGYSLPAKIIATTKIKDYKSSIKLSVSILNSTSLKATWNVLDVNLLKLIRAYSLECIQYTENTTKASPQRFKHSFNPGIKSKRFFRHFFNNLMPQSYYYIELKARQLDHTTYYKSDVMKTWPKRLEPPQYVRLRLSCELSCVVLDWDPPARNTTKVLGYRVRFYRLVKLSILQNRIDGGVDNSKYKRLEKVEHNVTKTNFQTSSFEHYKGFFYEFEVAAYNYYEIGKPAFNKIMIMAGKPTKAPSNFKYSQPGINNPNQVKFYWNKVPQQSLEGQFRCYELECKLTKRQSTENSVKKRDNQHPKLYKTQKQYLFVADLLEGVEYACRIKVWITNSSGPWSKPLSVKIKEATLPAPGEIRLVRISSSEAEITWAWKDEYLTYYSNFLIYYSEDFNLPDKKWSRVSTVGIVTKYKLTSLSDGASYYVMLRAISKRKSMGLLSDKVAQVSLDKESWPSKTVNELKCASEYDDSILLTWSSQLNLTEISHFRVTFQGQTTFPRRKKLILSNANSGIRNNNNNNNINAYIVYIREMKELSRNIKRNDNSPLLYFTHRILQLYPNTQYTVFVEPIFKASSVLIGGRVSVKCETMRQLPDKIPNAVLINIMKSKRQIEVVLQQPSLENGTVDTYYLFLASYNPIPQLHASPLIPVSSFSSSFPSSSRSQILNNLPNLTPDHDILSFSSNNDLRNNFLDYSSKHNSIRTQIHLVLNISDDQAFPKTGKIHRIILGTNKVKGIIIDKAINESLEYEMKVVVCIKVDPTIQCRESSWSPRFSLNSTDILGQRDKPTNEVDKAIAISSDSKGPSNLTTTAIVIILALLIVAGLLVFVIFTVRRKRHTNSKLGVIYNNNGARLSKDKTIYDHFLKEPLVNNQTGSIVHMNSMRSSSSYGPFSQHSHPHMNNPYLIDNTKLTSTPDLLVRSTVHQKPFIGAANQIPIPLHADKTRDGSIPVNRLSEHISRLKETDSRLFSQEYESIDSGQQFRWDCSQSETNRLKNRYANVVAYDHTRVVLQTLLDSAGLLVLGSDYINANYIDGYNRAKAYIATQGPLSDTLGDFWRMIWEQNSRIIVMMTRLEERDRIKCDQYWPLGGKGCSASYSYVTVTVTDIVELAYYTIRRFTIEAENEQGMIETREIRQLQFTAWPDHGVPSHPAPLLMFMRRVRSEIPAPASLYHGEIGGMMSNVPGGSMMPQYGPIVVHCSAGVGRTGAFIAIDIQLERIRLESHLNIYECVRAMRSQRNYMVQTEDQYVFVHEVLQEAIQCGNTEVSVTKLGSHIELLSQIEISPHTGPPSLRDIGESSGSTDAARKGDSAGDGVHLTGLQLEFEKLLLTSSLWRYWSQQQQQQPNNGSMSFLSNATSSQQNQIQYQSPTSFSSCHSPIGSCPSNLISINGASPINNGISISNFTPITFETANLPVNQFKNRILQILPPDFSRVSISCLKDHEGSDYINASWIDGYRSRRTYIATQAPLEDTVDDFWRMVWEQNSSMIVMLTKLKEGNRERCSPYWPSTQQTFCTEHFSISPIAEYNMTSYTIREWRLTHDGGFLPQHSREESNTSNETSDGSTLKNFRSSSSPTLLSRVVRQFQFGDWLESEGLPLATPAFLDLILQVHKTRIGMGLDGPITVHCSAGTARTGIFIALSNIIDRMKHESVIDLFQTVKLLRWQRPALIQTEDQYQYCYTAALEYLKIYEQFEFE